MTTNKVINIPFINKVLIQQQTDGGLVNIAPIVDLVNEKRLRQGKAEVQLHNYFETGPAQEYLNAMVEDMGIKELVDITTSVQDVEIIEEQRKITIKELKELKLYKDTRGKFAGTWFTPLLAVDIVGWLDPEIKLYFNKIVMKELFKKRMTVSDKIRTLTDKIVIVAGKQDPEYYATLNYKINLVVFNTSHTDIRNDATDEQFTLLSKLIDTMMIYIDEGIDTTPQSILDRVLKVKLL